jgi:two-component system nitrate/nitrite response regulator NarL
MSRAASASPVRVLLGDSHELFVHGLRRLLGPPERVEVVGSAEDGAELITKAAELHPDLILVDAELPGVDPVEAIRGVRAAAPEARVLVMTTPGSSLDTVAAEKAGAAGFLRKDLSAAHVVTAVPAVAAVVSALAELTPP